MPHKNLEQSDSSNISEQVFSYFEDIPEVVAVYLFGSQARGLQRNTSDIDLAVLLERDQLNNRFKLRKKYNRELSRILRKDLHIVIMNDLGETILAQVFKYGRCILNRKPEVLSRFKMYRIAMIAEFEYYRSITARGFLKRFGGGNSDR